MTPQMTASPSIMGMKVITWMPLPPGVTWALIHRNLNGNPEVATDRCLIEWQKVNGRWEKVKKGQ